MEHYDHRQKHFSFVFDVLSIGRACRDIPPAFNGALALFEGRSGMW